MQYTDGSWGWPLTAPPTYGNILGPIAMGVAQAYRQTADAGMYSTVSDAGAYLLTKTNNFSPSDGYLAAELDRLLGVTTYTAHVKANFYDQLAAGTYNRNGLGTLYTTASYVNLIRTNRSGSQANLAAWDIGMGLVGAAECGESTAEWIAGVKAEIDELNASGYYDVIGLAGAVYGLAFVGEDYDPTAGAHASAANLSDLAVILAGYQIAGGGFAWNSAYVIPNDGNETIQETGYAILALNEVSRATYLSAIQGAADYMMGVQLGTGGWENYPTSGENNEVTAEALWGIATAYPPPVHNVTKDVYYSTIQGAVDNAASGNVIHAAAGIYEEQVYITIPLTLQGDGAGATIILSPSALPLYFTTSYNNRPVVYLYGTTGVVLENLTVDGAGRGNANYRFIGVGFRNAGGTIQDCEVKDIRDTPFSGVQHGVAIYSFNDDGIPRTINVYDNTITGFQKNAMALNAGDTTPLTVDVDGNTVTGYGPTATTAQNGIQVWADVGTGTVSNNTITGIGYTGTGWVATSILNFYTDLDITGNTISNGHTGIYNIDGAGTISGNTLTIQKMGSYGYGIIATDPPGAKPSPVGQGEFSAVSKAANPISGTASTIAVAVEGNTLVFSGIDNSGTVGIEADAGYGPHDISFTADDNSVSGFETGFGFYECTSGCDVGVFAGVTLRGNTISGNTAYGVYTDGYYIDARLNYWGTLHGPADPVGTIEVPKMPAPSVADAINALPVPNLGNAVNENVDYWPWNGPATGHAGGGIWASGYVNPTANDIFMGLDAGALDGVDPMDTVSPPPPPIDYLYLYSVLAPGMPIENYSVDIRKEEASLATDAKGWDLRALTDHTADTINLSFLLDALPSGYHPTLHDLTTGDYKDLSSDPTYSYTSPGTETPSAFRLLIGDSTKPAVAVTAPNGGEYLIVGTPYNVTWTSSDATGVLRHYIWYSATGAAPYTLIDSTDGATLAYSWTPLAAAATAGIKVTARDSVMNEETDISDYSFTVLASSTVSYGAIAGWNLVSVPMLQGVMTPAAVFGDDYGATPYYTFGFSPSTGYSIPATLTMGQGYWLGSNSAQVIDADGTPLSGASLPLLSGFNIIGNPFATDMDVADLAFTDGSNTYDIAGAAGAGWLINVLYGYNGTAYYIQSSTLELWNGYWVPMLADGISAVYSPTVVVPTPKAVPVVESSDPEAWKVELGAVLKTDAGIEAGDMIAAFGVRSDATAGFSPRYDAPRPPRSPSENFVELSFAGTDEAFRSRFGDAAYARKFMPADKAGWEIVVKTSAPGDVTLRWDNSAIAALPAIVKVDLYDAATGTVIDMKTASSYTYAQKGTEQRFSINKPGGSVPETWELSQNYPNPFNPTTTIAYGLPSDAAVTIEVFNFLGQKVATLLTGEAVQQAGYHEVTFDAATLASGFYYYTITAKAGDGGNFTDVRKMILLK